MAEVLPAGLIVRRQIVGHVDEVSAVFADAVAAGFEGVVVKKLDAPYAAGRRDSGWVKLKPTAHLRPGGDRRRMGLRPARRAGCRTCTLPPATRTPASW